MFKVFNKTKSFNGLAKFPEFMQCHHIFANKSVNFSSFFLRPTVNSAVFSLSSQTYILFCTICIFNAPAIVAPGAQICYNARGGGFLQGNSIQLDVGDFSLSDTLECGQCFTWRRGEDGAFYGLLCGQPAALRQCGAALFAELPSSAGAGALRHYLGLDENYASIHALFSQIPVLRDAVSFAPGLRVMKQPLWDTLLCFILSQNNNIPRIQGIVQRLRDCLGDAGGFPSPARLAACTLEELAPLRCGFRARYLLDAAQKWSCGALNEALLRTAPLEDARAHLMQVRGVGPKVADCVLLFGAQRYEAFPQDVWIKRIMDAFFPDGLPDCAQPYAGIAQQYLFHYARTSGLFDPPRAGRQEASLAAAR